MLDEVSEAAGTTSGSMEFEVEGDDTDAFFPVVVDFVSQKGLCGVEVRSVLLSCPVFSRFGANLERFTRLSRRSSPFPTRPTRRPSSTLLTRWSTLRCMRWTRAQSKRRRCA